MGKKAKIGKRRKDRFYHLAKETGYRARSAFKIIQLNRKYQFLQQSRVLVDLCAAPGGWLQAAANHMPLSSVIIGVDLVPIKPIKNVVTLQEDITTDKCRQALHRELKTWKANCFLNDGAPNVGSSWIQDAYSQATLTLSALKLTCEFLKQGGWFITKVFRSKDYQALMWVFQQLFQKVHSTKPQASRAESAEIFVVCKGYLAPDKIDPKLLDPKYVFGEIEVDKNKKTLSFHQLEHSKKKAAEGYTLDNPMVYKDCSAAEFVLSDNHMVLLGSARSLKFDKESEVFERHPSTSDEVKECCKDVQVLGKRELRLLLSWRRKMRDFMKSVGGDSDNDDSHCDKPGEHSLQETDMDVVDKQVEVLRSEEEAALKRKRKNLRKKIFKTKEKLALRLQATEDNPGCERDQELFKLANITSQQHLSELHKGNMREDQDSLGSESPDSEDEMNGTESESILSEDDLMLTRDGKLMQINQDNGTFDSSKRDDGDGDGDSDGGVNGDVDSDVGVNDLVLEKTESNPLIVQFPEEKEAASKARQTSSWFSKDVFAGVENEDDEDLELDAMLEPGSHQSKGRRTVTTDQESEPCVEISNPIAGDETAVDPSGMCTDDGDSDDEDSDYEDLKPSRERTMEGDGVEVVPVGKKRVRKLDPQGLALGALLVSSKKAREEVIDSSYNRWTHGDEDLPDWFEEDEKFHCQKQLPVTKEMVMQYQKRLKEINARPIKKIAEAKARKKAKLLKRLERARKKAESISDAVDVSEREKAQQLKMLYKKAGVMNKKKDVQYVVAKKGTGKRVPRPAGVSGPYKVVDPRMKKDRRKKPRNSKKGSNFRSRKG